MAFANSVGDQNFSSSYTENTPQISKCNSAYLHQSDSTQKESETTSAKHMLPTKWPDAMII
ncbi:hypothetical protein BDV38DRAFT_14518 [Aspergillus pseudotamarii]|uniref:Uncharacterized protein n=1 Tax=Aspergillus pseudotamarii TaxID=132259 RepID=A0A5N6SES7_ASPPS|nr:uncharacterized protein BDV38DRAFT_14518 [Aspergillus pseudotamarii]KAE8131614.1 hypothetical protein BDV38DRAFT_14518 [Aspergillus pseudotamarii]